MDIAKHVRSNQVLASLPPAELEELSPHLRDVRLVAGEQVYRALETVDRVYFVHSGVVSLAVPTESTAVEIGVVGAEGMLGATAVLGISWAPTNATVRVGGTASRVNIGVLRQMAERSAALRDIVIRQEATLALYAHQSAACNALHSVEQRVSRWLLEILERIDGNSVPLTQELLADMIGVQRTTVTMISRKLQLAGAIECRRGQIRVARPDLLETSVCECHDRMHALRSRLSPEQRAAPSRMSEEAGQQSPIAVSRDKQVD